MYQGYRAIAGAYDALNADVDYAAWGAFIEECFKKYLPAKPEIVLDLACGTGRMTFELCDRGYDLIGIDGSADMLSEAYRKSTDRTIRILDEAGTDDLPAGVKTPLFLQQDMRAFELYGTVDAAVCCLDSMNYLTEDGDLDKCLACLYLYIAPGGLLIFDVNSVYKFENVYGNNAYVLENTMADGLQDGDSDADERAVLCAWQNEYHADTKRCAFYLSLFTEGDDGRYTRTDEEQCERCYPLTELESALDRTGFDLCGVFGGTDFSPAVSDTQRWHIVARTRKRGDWYLSD